MTSLRAGCLAALGVLAVAPWSKWPLTSGPSAAAVPSAGLIEVSVKSFQALAPPYKPPRIVLKGTKQLRSFDQALRTDHIGVRAQVTTLPGCAGGTQYTAVLTYQSGRRTTLDAYQCGGTISGNVTGHVAAFLHYLGSVLA